MAWVDIANGESGSSVRTKLNALGASDDLKAPLAAPALTGAATLDGGALYRVGGTDVSVADGGTGRSTSTTAFAILAAGTTATGAQQTLGVGATTDILVGGGASALPVWTAATGTGAPVRADGPTLTGLVIFGGAYASGGTVVAPSFNTDGATGAFNVVPRTGSGTVVLYNPTGDVFHIYAAGADRAVISVAGVAVTGAVTATTFLKTGVYTVATLPAAATAGAGACAAVTDGTAPVFAATVVGGGAIFTPVISDGANWKVG